MFGMGLRAGEWGVESDADNFMSPMRGPNFVVFTFLLYKMSGGRKMNYSVPYITIQRTGKEAGYFIP